MTPPSRIAAWLRRFSEAAERAAYRSLNFPITHHVQEAVRATDDAGYPVVPGRVVVDAKIRLAPVGAEPDPALRRLRPAEDA